MLSLSYEFPLLPIEVTSRFKPLIEENRILAQKCASLGVSRIITAKDGRVLLPSRFVRVLTSFREKQKKMCDKPLFVIYEEFDEAIDLFRKLAMRNAVFNSRIEEALQSNS